MPAFAWATTSHSTSQEGRRRADRQSAASPRRRRTPAQPASRDRERSSRPPMRRRRDRRASGTARKTVARDPRPYIAHQRDPRGKARAIAVVTMGRAVPFDNIVYPLESLTATAAGATMPELSGQE